MLLHKDRYMGILNNITKVLETVTQEAKTTLEKSDLGKEALSKLDQFQNSEIVKEVKAKTNDFTNEIKSEYATIKKDIENKQQGKQHNTGENSNANTINKETNQNQIVPDFLLQASGINPMSDTQSNYVEKESVTDDGIETKIDNKDSQTEPQAINEVETVLSVLTEAIEDRKTHLKLYPESLENEQSLLSDKQKIEQLVVQQTGSAIPLQNIKIVNDSTDRISDVTQKSYFAKVKQNISQLNREHLIDLILKMIGYRNDKLNETVSQKAMRTVLETLSSFSLATIGFFLFKTLFRAYGFKFILAGTVISHLLFKTTKKALSDDVNTEAGAERAKAEAFLKTESENNISTDNDYTSLKQDNPNKKD